MARPCKPVAVTTKNWTKKELADRKAAEGKLKGNDDKVKAPSYLTNKQKRIFNIIVKELKASGILCNLDVYVLTTCAIAIDRLRSIEELINKDIENLRDSKLMASKDKYTKDLWKSATELSLSPSSRAKIGNLNIKAKDEAEDPLLTVLRGGAK